MVAVLSSIERHLPGLLASPQMQWIPWVYAIWQLLRRNLAVLWLLSVLPFAIRVILFRKRYLVKMVPIASQTFPANTDQECPYNVQDEEEEETYWQQNQNHGDKLLSVTSKDRRRDWPPTWRAVQYKRWHYLTSRQALARLAACISRCNNSLTHGVVFGEWRDLRLVGEELSRDQGLEKILGGQHLVSVEEIELSRVLRAWQGITTPIRHVEVSRMWWGMLGLLPALLQVWSLNALATLVSLFVILIDFNRHAIHAVYERVFLEVRLFIKPLFKQKTNVYKTFSHIFSSRWLATDWTRAFAYSIKKGEEFKLYNFSKVRDLDVVHITAWGEFEYGKYNIDSGGVICLWERRNFAIPRVLHPFTFAIAESKIDIFVE